MAAAQLSDNTMSAATSGLEFVSEPSVLLDSDGAIIFANTAWYEFASNNGYSGDRFEGVNYLSVCDACDGAEAADASWFALGLRSILAGQQNRYELVYPCHSADLERWFKAIASRHGTHVVVIHVDITREYQFNSDQYMPFRRAATIHELKTPLNSIIGFAQLALQGYRHEYSKINVEECIETIENSGSYMLRIINDLLQASPSVKLQTEVFDLASFIEEVCDSHRGMAKQRDVRLVNAFDGNSLFVRADIDKLSKIVNNIVSNAVKYSHIGGTVTVDVSRNRSNGAFIRVHDEGVGIAADNLSKIFDPFTRFHNNTEFTETREGTGLGLAVARNLAQVHGGDIHVESVEGEGSVFTVMLPSWCTHFPFAAG